MYFSSIFKCDKICISDLCEDNGGCMNGAVCSTVNFSVECECNQGFDGEFCERGVHKYSLVTYHGDM